MKRDHPSESSCRISVVIPTYNYGHFLSKAIDSVLAQTVAPLEILVADDGSTDHTAEMVARYGDAVKIMRFDHQGVYSLRSRMLAEIHGEWFLNLDADNWIEPDFLERMAEVIRSNEEDARFAFAYPDMEVFGDREERVERPDFDVNRLKQGNYVDMNSVIRLEAARRFGFDPAFNSGQGDYDFFLTLAENGLHGVRVPEALLHYRIHEDSISRRVGHNRNQRRILRRILRKHHSFFSPAEMKAAKAAADNRLLAALIGWRSPFAGQGQRLRDWILFMRSGWRHAEMIPQTTYCFAPCRYFRKRIKAPEMFVLFRDIPQRRALVQQVMKHQKTGAGRGQLFGFEELWNSDVPVDSNLRFPRTHSVRQTLLGWRERWIAPRIGLGFGDEASVRSHLWQMNRSQVVVAMSDNTGMPAARHKARGTLRTPLVYVSIGLPERMRVLEAHNPIWAKRVRKILGQVDRFLTYGHAEAEWLRDWLGADADVQFMPFGVDTEEWKPVTMEPTADVLSIGADPMRDFDLLIQYARSHPDVKVALVTRHDSVRDAGEFPANLQVRFQIPPEDLKKAIARARVVVLPVKENTYSGATTTLLQCMAMGKAVAVSRVGAIREGYGFEDGETLRWLEPGSATSLSAVLDELLSHEEACADLGRKARAHVEAHLNWGRYIHSLKDNLKEWLDGGETQ